MPDRASSEGRAIRQVELLSNKLLTTAFEASLGCVAVMRRAKRRQRGSRDSYRAPKYQQTRASTLWAEGKTICGFIVKVRFHTALRCRKELFMLYKDCTSTGESLYFLYFREKKQSMLTQPKEEKQRKYRHADGFIVLKNVGNATGGKGATYGNNQEGNLRNLCFVNRKSSKSEGKFPIFRSGNPHYPKETCREFSFFPLSSRKESSIHCFLPNRVIRVRLCQRLPERFAFNVLSFDSAPDPG